MLGICTKSFRPKAAMMRDGYVVSLSLTFSRSSAAVTVAFGHTKPACTGDLVGLTLFHRRVSKCRPPASARTSQLLIIFLNQGRSYFFFGIFDFSCVLLSLTSCKNLECLYKHLHMFPTSNMYTNSNMEMLKKTKLHGLSPRANYTDRAAAAGRRS